MDLGVEITMARMRLGWALECHRRQWNGKVTPAVCGSVTEVRVCGEATGNGRLGWRLWLLGEKLEKGFERGSGKLWPQEAHDLV